MGMRFDLVTTRPEPRLGGHSSAVHLGSVPRRIASALIAALVVAEVTGCGLLGGDPRAGATPPDAAGECNDMPRIDGDPGLALGSHWASDHHSWGDSVTVYACDEPSSRGWVSLLPSG